MTGCESCGVFDHGETVEFEATFVVDGVLTDPLAVTLYLRRPSDGTVLTAAGITHPSAGVYRFEYTFPEDGQWFFRWESTGPAAAAKEGSVLVRKSKVLV